MVASYTGASYVPDRLIAGNADELIGRKITVITGQNLVRGTVLGKITAGGKYTISLAAASDGSGVVDLVLAEDCDASSADKLAIAYERGDFIQEALTLGAGHTAASIKEVLRGKGIFLISSIGA